MIRRLILWDIDGTLVRAGSLGASVFDDALESVLGRRPDRRVIMSGKTDPQIVREYLLALGVEETEGLVAGVLDGIGRGLAAGVDRMLAEGKACPGAAELLAHLAGDDRVLNSVLTGNIAANARVKLAAFGLDGWLDLAVGAYGSDDADRVRLVPVALSRVAECYGVALLGEEVWVIGDTPLDLACAQASGAHCLLVGTGRLPANELEGLGADAVLDDLTETETIIKILTGDL